jgi:signal peptidase I
MAASAQYAEVVTKALRCRGRTIVRVHGRSMYPTLHNGARLEVQPVTFDELRRGDLVVFNNGNGIICHRLIRKACRLCYLKGDTNLFTDPPVIWAQVLGRVTRVIDDDLHIHSLDTPRQRLRGAFLAHFSYPYALYFNALHALGRCAWWSPGIEWTK